MTAQAVFIVGVAIFATDIGLALQRKLAAGTSQNFLVLQVQRDLSAARNDELRAMIDYQQSVVDLETVQDVPLR